MASRKELPIGHGSSLISFAKENLKKEKQKNKLIKRKRRKEKNNPKTEWPKAKANANYKILYFYRTGEEETFRGSEFAEGILPVNAQEAEKIIPLNIRQKPSFLQRIKKIFQKV